MPILAQCTEPLADGAKDMRGLWVSTDGDGRRGHVERVEQCGNRYVVTSSGLVHVVSRYMDGDQLKWDYPSFGTTTMDRICKLPQNDIQ